jgi:hypothetical protein
MKVIMEIVGALGTGIKVWLESGTITVVVVVGAINIMEVRLHFGNKVARATRSLSIQ